MTRQLCKRLRELRIAHTYSQAELAYILGIRQEQYSKYESGVREIPLHLFVKICTIYKASADDILGLKPSLSPKHICSNERQQKSRP